MQDDLKPRKVLVVAAHADDNEFCFGGSIAKWIDEGAEVHYLVVTDGRRGSEKSTDSNAELIATRQDEQQKAAKFLGVSSVTNLFYEDGRMELSWDLRRDITRVIREIKPDTVLCMDPQFLYSSKFNYVNHNDHRVVGQATFDSVYPLARDENSFDELQEVEPHKTKNLLMYNLEKQEFFIDISKYLDKKIEALLAHESQFGNAESITSTVKDIASKSSEDTGLVEGFIRLSIS